MTLRQRWWCVRRWWWRRWSMARNNSSMVPMIERLTTQLLFDPARRHVFGASASELL